VILLLVFVSINLPVFVSINRNGSLFNLIVLPLPKCVLPTICSAIETGVQNLERLAHPLAVNGTATLGLAIAQLQRYYTQDGSLD
jgi:hypothetical protein